MSETTDTEAGYEAHDKEVQKDLAEDRSSLERVAEARRVLTGALDARDHAIHAARRAGVRVAPIAEAAGLSRSQIMRIMRGERQ